MQLADAPFVGHKLVAEGQESLRGTAYADATRCAGEDEIARKQRQLAMRNRAPQMSGVIWFSTPSSALPYTSNPICGTATAWRPAGLALRCSVKGAR